jgi:hypothetical protein
MSERLVVEPEAPARDDDHSSVLRPASRSLRTGVSERLVGLRSYDRRSSNAVISFYPALAVASS